MDQKFLRALFYSDDVFEVRVLGASAPGWRTPHTESGYFNWDNIHYVDTSLNSLASYSGAYVTINPVLPDLLARAQNKICGAQRNMTTSDADVLRRRWLFLDIDPVRPAGISATEAEKEDAQQAAFFLRDALTARGWPEPVEVDSGNGYYLLYKIDLPPDDGGLVSRCLRACAQIMGDNDAVHVDTSVANAARIARIPGTWNRKGEDIPMRPHRLCQCMRIPADLNIVPESKMIELAADIVEVKHSTTTGLKTDTGEYQGGTRPGDRYNEHADLTELLQRHGWQMVGEHESNQQWRRPGKTQGNHSATWNGSVFYVFSSAAQPFLPNKGYSAFAVYSMLEHGADHKEAARALAQQGYADPVSTYPDYRGVDMSEFLAQFDEIEMPAQDKYRQVDIPFPDYLLSPPGFLGDVIRYNQATAPKQQPVLALAGALALQAILCARKVKTPYGTRPNLMICGVAPSGAGKEHARKINRDILFQSGLSALHAEGLKSGSALMNALAGNPAILFQLDEYGRFLKASRNPDKAPYQYEIISKLLTLYSSSGSVYETDRYADREKGGIQIQEPHAIIYGTTVPKSLYEGLTEESVTDGFLARTLIFDAGQNQPLRRILPEQAVPRSILDTALWWGEYNPGGGNLAPAASVVPVTDEAEDLAREFVHVEAKKIAEANDSPLATLWTRTAQNADKLALLYAVSVDHREPVVDLDAARWGYDLAQFLTGRMIRLVDDNVAHSAFHGQILKIKHILQSGGLTRGELLRRARMRSRELEEILEFLLQSGDLKTEEKKTGGRIRIEFVLVK